MGPDFFLEEIPVVRFLRATTSRNRPLSLCILGGCLREVRLYSTSIIFRQRNTKKKAKLLVFFCILAWFPFIWCHWFVVRVAFLAMHLLLFIPTIGSLWYWRTDCATRAEKGRTSKYIENSNISVTLTFTSIGAKLWVTALKIFKWWKFSHSLKMIFS